MSRRPYSDDQLDAAVRAARSWRGVLRELGLTATSAGSARSVRRRADQRGLSTAHFTRQRTWSERQLVEAVASARSWPEVSRVLKLSEASGNLATVRGHARRLGLNIAHLARPEPHPVIGDVLASARPRCELLRTAAPHLAAAWFQLRGYEVLWPQEGCRYDLAVSANDRFLRIQVKTSTYRKANTYLAQICGTRQDRHSAYDVDELDYFFIVDALLNAFLIPFETVAGRRQLSLGRYRRFQVCHAGQWLDSPVSADASPGP